MPHDESITAMFVVMFEKSIESIESIDRIQCSIISAISQHFRCGTRRKSWHILRAMWHCVPLVNFRPVRLAEKEIHFAVTELLILMKAFHATHEKRTVSSKWNDME